MLLRCYGFTEALMPVTVCVSVRWLSIGTISSRIGDLNVNWNKTIPLGDSIPHTIISMDYGQLFLFDTFHTVFKCKRRKFNFACNAGRSSYRDKFKYKFKQRSPNWFWQNYNCHYPVWGVLFVFTRDINLLLFSVHCVSFSKMQCDASIILCVMAWLLKRIW